jgi:hypothetical protein
MKIVKVTYTAKPDFVGKNQENINAVMNDLRTANDSGIKYATYLGSDGKNFMHFAQFENSESEQVLFTLESFQSFQKQLKESGPEVPPQQEIMMLVASSYDVF